MKNSIISAVLLLLAVNGNTQRIDSLAFHLYTDSLKKGTNNYINVDGKTSEGRWLPMTSRELILTATDCSFQGNDLVLPWEFAGPYVTVKAVLRSNPEQWIERKIWVKQLPDPELPKDEPSRQAPARKRRN